MHRRDEGVGDPAQPPASHSFGAAPRLFAACRLQAYLCKDLLHFQRPAELPLDIAGPCALVALYGASILIEAQARCLLRVERDGLQAEPPLEQSAIVDGLVAYGLVVVDVELDAYPALLGVDEQRDVVCRGSHSAAWSNSSCWASED